MIPFRMRAAVALAATALLAAGGTTAFTLPSASAASTEDPPPGDPPSGNTSPGTGDDAYKPDDPFVDHGNAPKNIPAATVVAESFQLFPTKLTTSPGKKLTLDNRDIAIHNIQTLKGKIAVKSPDADPGKKVTFKAPMKPGTYNVGCYYHQAMVMKLVVKK